MADLIPFTFDTSTIRVIEDGGQAWFVARDVADALGYGDPSTAVRRHCRDGGAKRLPIVDGLGRTQEALCILEGDVLRLIMRSKLPQAQRFEAWVFDVVLPTIARTGQYVPAPVSDPMAILSDPAALRGLLLTYTEKVQALENTVAEQGPKVQALDRIATAAGSVCLTDAAKNLGVRPRTFFQWLRDHGWIYRRPGSEWVAFQPRLNQGVLEHKVTVIPRADGTEHIREQVRVTPKGLARLAELMVKERGIARA